MWVVKAHTGSACEGYRFTRIKLTCRVGSIDFTKTFRNLRNILNNFPVALHYLIFFSMSLSKVINSENLWRQFPTTRRHFWLQEPLILLCDDFFNNSGSWCSYWYLIDWKHRRNQSESCHLELFEEALILNWQFQDTYLKSFTFNTHEHPNRRNTAKKLFNLEFIEEFAVMGFLSLRLNFKGRMEIHKYRNLPLKCVTRVRKKVRMVQTNALSAFYRKCFLKSQSFNSRSRKLFECFCFILLKIRLIRYCSQWRLIENFEYKANNELTECHG